MKEFIDRHKIANTVRMLRARGYAGALILVEGDDDARWLRKFLRPEETRPLPAFGKDRVLAALQALRDGASADGVLAVVDADFDHLLRCPADADVLRTDFHDVECMLLGSSALWQVLAEYGSRTSSTSCMRAAARCWICSCQRGVRSACSAWRRVPATRAARRSSRGSASRA